MPELTAPQREVLRALADCVCPAVARDDDPTGYWSTPGSATGAHEALGMWLETAAPPDVAEGLAQLLDALALVGFPNMPQLVQELQLANLANLGPEAAVGAGALINNTKMLVYSMPDAGGRNPFWEQMGYPGPQAAPQPSAPRGITPYEPSDGEVLRADVVVVGSGAGGGVVAGELALAGHDVVVLEAGGHHTEADFQQLEAWAHQNLYYRGGLQGTADANVVFLAGATLGGGTTINWQNWVRPSDHVRREWAEHGLDDVATEEFDRHLDAVGARVGANDRCSDLNGPHERMVAGAEALGWSWHRAVRNEDPERYDPELAGYTHFGDLTGAKQGTLRTYLQDAHDAGAKILVRTTAQQVCTADGRASGVAATWSDPATGETRRITVDAPTVVVACGAMETPALLLRSGIGGPAAGKNLRLHPATTTFGVYEGDQRAWWGPPQSAVVDEFREHEGNGWLIEGSQYYSGVYAAFLAWNGGVAHKELVGRMRHLAPMLFVLRDHGGGEVTVDDDGQAVHTYAVTDETDERHFREALRSLLRLHEAAGASEIHYSVPGVGHWTRGEDLDEFFERLMAFPIGAGGLPIGCAHQMGSARLGTDPQTSVARPTGELHDVPGVWIGDTSAFPTASGANPMATCMAMARRTAENIHGSRLPERPGRTVDLAAHDGSSSARPLVTDPSQAGASALAQPVTT